MSEVSRQESPLVQCLRVSHSTRHFAQAGVVLSERALLGHLNLRGNPAEQGFPEAVSATLGCALPVQPNTVAEGDEGAALWLGPDEWLLVTPPGKQNDLLLALRQALGGLSAAVTDVSSGQTVISVSGRHVRDVLAKGCTLDLHPKAFGQGSCAQTLMAKTPALLWLQDTTWIDVIVRRSFADYLWQWLEDAAEEFGFAVAE